MLVGEADLVADGGSPSGLFSSCAMRLAVARAAIRRGWVWPIRPATPRPSVRQILGSWVVLPEPVSPQTMTTWCADRRGDLVAARGHRQLGRAKLRHRQGRSGAGRRGRSADRQCSSSE
jgi:hypothetical protein